MDLLLRAASGRLSEVFADRTLADDRFARTIGFFRTGAKLAAGWDDASHAIHARFRQGCAAWIAHDAGPSRRVLPARHGPGPADRRRRSVGGGVRATWPGGSQGTGTRSSCARRSPNVSVPTRSANSSRRCRPIRRPSPRARSPDACSTSSHDRRARGRTIGWWRARARRPASRCSRTTRTCSPCSPARGSRCTCGLPGTRRAAWRSRSRPGILLGTTAHHSWGVTNVSGDVQDLYVEHLNDERTAAEHDGTWEPLTVHRELIHVRGAAEPVVVDVSRDATRPDHRDGRGGQHAHRAHPARIGRDVRAPVDGVRLRHPSVARPRCRERDQLRGVPSRGLGRGVPGSELRLRRRGRDDRLSMLGTVPVASTPATAPRRCPDGPPGTSGTDGSRSTSCRGRSTRRTDTWSPRTTGSTTTATRT